MGDTGDNCSVDGPSLRFLQPASTAVADILLQSVAASVLHHKVDLCRNSLTVLWVSMIS